MTTSTSSPTTSSPTARAGRRIWPVALALVGLLAVVVGALVLIGPMGGLGLFRDGPAFPSLAQTPDPTLVGTVAYFKDATACVRVVAAAGQLSKDVLCIGDQNVAEAKAKGKLVGPQLVWRPDNRLEVTMFRLTDPPGPTFNPGWQKVIDVTTGAVEDVPDADVPSAPNLGTQQTVSPDGRKITWTSDTGGEIEVVLHETTGPRTLLSAQGPGEGTYRLDSAFWAPNWQWVAADDGRILVITTDRPAVTRILTDESTQGGYGGYPRFAVTGADLL